MMQRTFQLRIASSPAILPRRRFPMRLVRRLEIGRTSGRSSRRLRPTAGAIPSAVNMPWTVMHPAAPGGKAPGQDGGWLGKAFDPFHVDGDPNAAGFEVQGLGLPAGISRRTPR